MLSDDGLSQSCGLPEDEQAIEEKQQSKDDDKQTEEKRGERYRHKESDDAIQIGGLGDLAC